MIRKHDKPLPQLVRRIIEYQKNSSINRRRVRGTLLKMKWRNGPILQGCRGRQFKQLHTKDWMLSSVGLADRFVFLKDLSVIKIHNIVQNESGCHIIGKQFLTKNNFFLSPLESSRLEIFSVSRLSSSLHHWPIAEILCKAVLLPAFKKNDSCVVFPLYYCENH